MARRDLVGISLFVLLVFPSASRPQKPAAPPASQSKSATPPPADPYSSEPYVIELLENRARFEADGKGQRELKLRVRIQSESAVREFGLLAYPYASSFESLDVVSVRVHKPDGSVLETPSSDIQDLDSAVSREAPMYTDQREKHIAVKSLSTGDVLEAQLRWTVHDPMAPGYFWLDHSYFRAGICIKEFLSFDVPANVPVKLRNSEPQPAIREEAGRRLYTFNTSHLKKEPESKIPEWEKNFHGEPPPDVEISSFPSWEEVGKWFGSLEQAKAVATPEIRAKAEELTKGKTSEDEKLHAIYDFVSTRFRYIGIDLGMGRYSPHAASDVLVNRYGDCKDKHTLFAALLQAAGITSYPALISSKFRVDSSFPTMGLFDHVITAIPRGDSFLFLDTTPEVAPFGLLVQNIRDRQALVIPGAAAARLVATPADPPFPSFERAKIDANIDIDGTLDAKMRLEDRGDTELVLRLAYRSTPQNRWEELTQNIFARMGFAGKVSNVTVMQPEDTSGPFWLDVSYHRTDFPDWKNHRIILPAPPIFLAELNEEQKLSKEPLPLGALQDITYDSTVKLPQGFFPVIPEKVEEKKDFAEFSASFSNEDGALHGVLHFKTLVHEVPGKERSEFNDLSKSVDETSRRFIFVSGEFAAARLMTMLPSKVEDAIPVLEKKLAADPNDKPTLILLSQDYCKTGRAKDAVSLLEKAIEKAPDAQDFELALGNAYLALPDADKALLQYKKALGETAEPERLKQVAAALADANVHLEEAHDYASRAVSVVALQTMDISPDDVRPSDFALMSNLSASWDTLGWIKFLRGDTVGAEKYLEASWQLAQSPEAGEHLVEVLERLGQKQKAAAICNMAEAALGATIIPPDAKVRDKISEEMKRLRPFLGSQASSGAPKGRSNPPDAHAALADMRTMVIPLPTKLKGEAGRANFILALTNGPRVDNVVFVSGTEELRNAVAALAAAKYPQSFPDQIPTRIVRRASLNCSIYSKDCQLFFSTISESAAPPPIPIAAKILAGKTAEVTASPVPSVPEEKPVEKAESAAKPLFDAAKRAFSEREYAAAAQLYEQVVAKDPNYKEAWNDLGFSYGALGQYEKEEVALRKALALDPAARWAHYNLGNSLMHQKKYDEAIAEYQKEIASKSNNSLVYLNLGRVYVLTDKFADAIPPLETAASRMPTNPAVQFNLGLAYAKTSQREKAAQAFVRSVELEPTAERKNSVAYQLALNQLKLDEAQKYVEEAIAATNSQMKEISPDKLLSKDVQLPAALAAYWDTLGWVKFQQGKIPEAEKYVRCAWEVRSIGEIGDHLGQIYEKEGRKEDAIQMLSLALATSLPMPETKPRLVALLGDASDVDRRTEEARSLLARRQTIQIKDSHDAEGLAEFWIVLSPGPKAIEVKFISGDEALRPFIPDLTVASFPDPFPDSSDIKLLRRGRLTCLQSSGVCNFRLMSAETVHNVN